MPPPGNPACRSSECRSSSSTRPASRNGSAWVRIAMDHVRPPERAGATGKVVLAHDGRRRRDRGLGVATEGLGVGRGDWVARWDHRCRDDGRRTAKPATATTMTAATASNGLRLVFTWESLHGGATRVAAADARSGRRPRRGRGRATCVGPSVNQWSRTRSMSRSLVMPSDLPTTVGPSVRLEGGPHGAMGVMESGAGRPGRDAERLGDLGRGVARGSGAARGSPAGRAAAGGTRVRAGPDRRRESRSSGAAGPSTGSTRRFAVRRRSRVAWPMQTLMRRRWSHASKRSGSRRPRRSRQAITSASCRASSARSTSRRIRWAIANSRSTRGADQVDEGLLVAALCRLDEIAIHPSTVRAPVWRPSGTPVHTYR